ncbi:MAG: hypothetical protein OS112_06450 [Methanoregula sp.]|nr:MAG: hypothetical protein OS112_06450 [Methanoregula sp.]
MAGAEIIASGIGILCLIIFGYVLVGGILSVGENAASAQTDYVIMKESQRETAIDIPDSSPAPQFSCVDRTWFFFWGGKECTLTFNITNTGTEMLGSFGQMNVYVTTSENIINGPVWFPLTPVTPPAPYTFDPTKIGIGGNVPSGTWSYIQISPDIIHPGLLDAGEKIKVQINNFYFPNPPASFTITVVTPNGVTDTYSQ